jgi:hypothetical protein
MISTLWVRFCATLSRQPTVCSNVPRNENISATRLLRFAPRQGRKAAKTKVSFRDAKRNVSQDMTQALEIIMGAESVISRDRLFSMV